MALFDSFGAAEIMFIAALTASCYCGCLLVFLWKKCRPRNRTAYMPTSGVYITYEGVIRVVTLDGLLTGRDFKKRTNQILQLQSSYEDLVVIKNWDVADNTDDRAILDSNEALEGFLSVDVIQRSIEFPLVVDRKSFSLNAFPWLYPVMFENTAPAEPRGEWCFGVQMGQRVIRKNDPTGRGFGYVVERAAQGVIAVRWDDNTTTWENWGWQGTFDVIPANNLPQPLKPATALQGFPALPYPIPSSTSDFSSTLPLPQQDTFSTTITPLSDPSLQPNNTPIVPGFVK